MATTLNEEKMEINFDPHDWRGMLDLMERHAEFTEICFGKNEDGELVGISVNEDNITVETWQNNGWLRENIYWKEDRMCEELFHKL